MEEARHKDIISESVNPDCLNIKTLEGDILASLNDYIIRGVAGELYPCKPDIFNQTYELI